MRAAPQREVEAPGAARGAARDAVHGWLAALLVATFAAAPRADVASAQAVAAPRAPEAPLDEGREGAGGSVQTPRLEEPTPLERAQRRALDAGLDWLARRQAESVDGSFPKGNASKWAPVGVAALGALAYMAAGSSPGRGPHGAEATRVIGYLLDRLDARGFVWAQGDQHSQMHGHGYATLALAEAYGMSPRNERLGKALIAAVELIEGTQGSEGGWYYKPVVEASHEGSVTIVLVQALRAARNAGIRVDAGVIERAETYVLRLQKEDGTFRYQLGSDVSTVALTAAGISTLNMTGRYDDGAIRRGVDAIWSRLSQDELPAGDRGFPFYRRLYLAQAFWQLSDPSHFERWYEGELERLVRDQQEDGSWTGSEYGDAYATAVNCLVLALPAGLLPIFQR
jgi:hypothetical protein